MVVLAVAAHKEADQEMDGKSWVRFRDECEWVSNLIPHGS